MIALFKPWTLWVCVAAACSSTAVMAIPLNQKMPGPNGEQQQGSLNHVGMSRSGRFVLMPDAVNAFGGPMPGMYVRDIALQTTSLLSSDGAGDPFYAISPNGRYVAYWSASRQNKYVLDRETGIESQLPYKPGEHNLGLSDNGYVLLNKKTSTSVTPLVLYRIADQSEQTLHADGASLGNLYQRNPLSADGRVALYTANGQKWIYQADLNASTAFTPQWSGQNLGIAEASLASSGKFVAFFSNSTGQAQYLYRAALTASGSHTLTRYDLTPKHISLVTSNSMGLSITGNGRFISFYGYLEAGHPEFAAAQAVGTPGYTRLFRLDTRTNQLVTMTTSHDGGAIAGQYGTPLLNTTSVLSDDGSMMVFATNARNITPTPPATVGGEQNYHTFVSNGFARNYQFIDLPHTQNGWSLFNPMTLVGDHQWQGYVNVSPSSDAFLFRAGGKLVNGVYDTSSIWIGAGASLGQAAVDGPIIMPAQFSPQFPGVWRITFNDQTLKYSFSKPDWKRTVIFMQGQTAPGQDLFLRGGVDHAYAQGLGLTCNDTNLLCAIPIRHRNSLNPYTANWKVNDTSLDWYGMETGQTLVNGVNAAAGIAQGTAMDWTTNNASYSTNVAAHGKGYTPLNTWGEHYWILDVDMDCSKTVNGWFEVKSYMTNGSGWEPDITQAGAPYASGNHFAQCGKVNRFQRGNNSVVINPLP